MCASTASTFTFCTGASPRVSAALTSRLLSSGYFLHGLLILFHAITTALATLDVCQAPRLGVDVADLLVTLSVEVHQSLAGRRAHRLLEV